MKTRSTCVLLFMLICVTALAQAGLKDDPQDTVEILSDLDRAWTMVQQRDSSVYPLLINTLHRARNQGYKKGEGNALFTLGKYHASVNETDKAIIFYDSANMMFKESGDSTNIALYFQTMGILRLGLNEYKEAVQNFVLAAEVNIQIKRKVKAGDSYSNAGIAFERSGDYAKALDYFLIALTLYEEGGNSEDIGYGLNLIATVYGKSGEIDNASKYYKKSILLSETAGDSLTGASTKTNYGVLLKNNNRFDEAKIVLEEALDFFERNKHELGTVASLHNLGALYQVKKEYPKALTFYRKSLEANRSRDGYSDQVNYLGMAEIFFHGKQYHDALEFAHKAMAIANELKWLEEQVKVAHLLSRIFKAQEDHKNALRYFEHYTTFKDSLFNQQKSRQIKELQTKYETEKKEKAIVSLTHDRELQQAKLEQKTWIQYASVFGFFLILITGIIIFRNNKLKQESKRALLAEQLKHEHDESQKLKELDQLKSRFFANIAHEFRTPLTLILGPVENLLADLKNTKVKEQLTLVKTSTSRLVKLVNQLLDLSKLEAGAIKVHYVSDDIIPLLKGNTFAFQSLAVDKNIDLQFSSNTETLRMDIDTDKLEKILSNLLSNAFKFTPAGGNIKVTAMLTGDKPEDRQLEISVADSGVGIPLQDIPYVFNRFYQSHTVSKYIQGSGIGLELTKELVEICGGKISVSTLPVNGTRFTFTLPVRQDVGEPVGQGIVDHAHYFQPDLNDSEKQNSHRVISIREESQDVILVIEDNEDVRNFIVSSLQPHYKVITAADGDEGIASALEVIPDLIVSDVMMPGKNGYEVCGILKEDEKTSHIPLIMLTAKADIESKIDGLEQGADDYLPKPFHTKEFLARIKNLVQQRKLLQKKFGLSQIDSGAEAMPTKEAAFLSRLREIVEFHLTEEEYSVEDLGRDMAMSRVQLHRKVKALTNGSVSLYIRAIRLEHASRLLKEGLYNVSEVAYRVGFNSPTYFSTCFSEQYGFPPSDLLPEPAFS